MGWRGHRVTSSSGLLSAHCGRPGTTPWRVGVSSREEIDREHAPDNEEGRKNETPCSAIAAASTSFPDPCPAHTIEPLHRPTRPSSLRDSTSRLSALYITPVANELYNATDTRRESLPLCLPFGSSLPWPRTFSKANTLPSAPDQVLRYALPCNIYRKFAVPPPPRERKLLDQPNEACSATLGQRQGHPVNERPRTTYPSGFPAKQQACTSVTTPVPALPSTVHYTPLYPVLDDGLPAARVQGSQSSCMFGALCRRLGPVYRREPVFEGAKGRGAGSWMRGCGGRLYYTTER
ncbi:hypothetical protein FA13DRAFT_1713866 [Coprinellus micaceus]|uniref:Uncharacterized protein n=1 Tax=Coprinellus micaceus TaxID=71717 RepID=A0A4Y7SUU1_COPMI|nr:hypothetical protein FA13DRAFT_1713866 [Coprinellus micaceus]